jgi:hypothetical protein
MDDILVFSDNKDELKDIYAHSVSYTAEKLKLSLKPQILNAVKSGVPFLGFLVKPVGIYLQNKIKRRYKNRIAEIEHKMEKGILTELEASRRIESVTAHLLLARSRNFRNTVINGYVREQGVRWV